MIIRAAILAFALATPIAAQELTQEELDALGIEFIEEVTPQTRPPVTSLVTAAVHLRGLDKLTNKVEDFAIPVGEIAQYQRLEISVDACRRPPEGDKPDAFAFLHIRDIRRDAPDFEGWMIASSPALMALDHVRYDVWVIKCMTSAELTSFESESQSAETSSASDSNS